MWAMSWFTDKVLGFSVDNTVNKVHDIIDQKVEDVDEANRLKSAVTQSALAHGSVIVTILVAGARPALLWVAVMGLFIHFIANPIMAWFSIPIVEVDISSLAAMVGTGTIMSVIRTIEKKLKVNQVH